MPLDIPDDVHWRNASGQTALHWARKVPDELTFDLDELLARGADVNAQDAQGDTPLHTACTLRDLDTVKALVEAGADLELRNHYGNTPLYVAVTEAWFMPEMHTYLLEAGADPYAKNLQGKSAFSIVQRKGAQARPALAHLLGVPVPERVVPSVEDLGRERWGTVMTTARLQDKYDAFFERFRGFPWSRQWRLLEGFEAIKSQNLVHGNLARRRGDDFVGFGKFIKRTLSEDESVSVADRVQLKRCLKEMLVVSRPVSRQEPFDWLQDVITGFLEHHPEPEEA